MEDNLIRLHKFIADCGIASRRKAEEYITEGRVKVNDEVITALGTKIDPDLDIVQVDDQVVELTDTEKTYVLLHKPRGYVTTVHDPEGRETVMDLIKGVNFRIYPVGRLDYLSEGLLILTNDGDFTHMVTHPKHEINKVYEVKVFGRVNELLLKQLKMGVRVDGELLKPKSVRVLQFLPKKTWLEFRLTEGKNREIRRLCEAIGLTIDKLKRVAIEGLTINHLKPGDYQVMGHKEILKKLGVDENGKRVKRHDYKSPKKSANSKSRAGKTQRRRRPQHSDSPLASSPAFQRYRKESYYQTLEGQKRREAQAQQDSED